MRRISFFVAVESAGDQLSVFILLHSIVLHSSEAEHDIAMTTKTGDGDLMKIQF